MRVIFVMDRIGYNQASILMTHPYLRFVASYGCRNDPTRLLKKLRGSYLQPLGG